MMQQAHNASLEMLQVEFMDACYEIHQQKMVDTKKSKARKRFEARRAIEEHQEQKRLKELLTEWWYEVDA